MGVLEGIDNMRARADDLLDTFIPEFSGFLFRNATDERVAGFKSIACYRTGLDISLNCTEDDLVAAIENVITQYAETGNLRLADKCFIDYLVRQTLQVAGLYHKPGTLSLHSDSHLRLLTYIYLPSSPIPYRSWRQRYQPSVVKSCFNATHHQSVSSDTFCAIAFKLPIYPGSWIPNFSL